MGTRLSFRGRVQDLTKVERDNVTQCIGYESTVKRRLGIYPGITVAKEVERVIKSNQFLG
jgi:hypothetical protein